MRVLIDPHLLVWALAWPSKLPPKARQRIESSEIFASAASIWKIGIKSALGKLSVDPAGVLSVIEPAGFDLLYITGEHAAHVARLPQLHKDPFDRLLVAQAWVERMILLADDDAMGGVGGACRGRIARDFHVCRPWLQRNARERSADRVILSLGNDSQLPR